jgi:nucleotide-binding universal stress UspA family protein
VSEKILLAVDGSPAADKAAELLAGYRGDRAALAITVLNVQERPASLWPDLPVDLRPVESALQASGQAAAERARSTLQAAGLQSEACVRLGAPAEAILAEAQSRSAALIVMGTRGHGALHGFAFGSVAMRVAHASRAPVWLVHPECALPRDFGRSLRVLLALDGTAPSIRAARRLISWQRWLGTLDVQIAFVQQPLSYLATVLPPHDDVIGQWSTRGAESATQAVRQSLARAGIAHHLHISVGDAAQEIAHLAVHTGAELVALGTRGRGAVHHALMGSVALKTAVKASVPVMLVR